MHPLKKDLSLHMLYFPTLSCGIFGQTTTDHQTSLTIYSLTNLEYDFAAQQFYSGKIAEKGEQIAENVQLTTKHFLLSIPHSLCLSHDQYHSLRVLCI